MAFRSPRKVAALAMSGPLLLLLGEATPLEVPCLLLDPAFERSACRSEVCLSCHDGSVAREVLRHASHPVEVSYADAWLGGRAGLRSALPDALVLSDGLMTCATCHDGASLHPSRIAVEPGALCTECHDR